MNELDLATLDGLSEAVFSAAPQGIGRPTTENIGAWRGTYCSHCGAVRRMALIRLYWADRWAEGMTEAQRARLPTNYNPSPALFVAHCLECESTLTLVVFWGPKGTQLVALPSTYGGLSTPNTPESVAFYLDQAQKSQAMGALSAAVAMYRAALEHVLHEQGYTDGMLGKRIVALMEMSSLPSGGAVLMRSISASSISSLMLQSTRTTAMSRSKWSLTPRYSKAYERCSSSRLMRFTSGQRFGPTVSRS
jgi:hypothetical protein